MTTQRVLARNEVTDSHITLQYNGKWYCLPFIILADLECFHSLVERWACDCFSTHYVKMMFREHSGGIYKFMEDMIASNRKEFEPVLNVCELYNTNEK